MLVIETCVLVGETQLRTLSTYSRTHLPLTAFIDSGCRYAQITTVFPIQDIMLTLLLYRARQLRRLMTI
jgi:hypothetical protein